MTRSLVNRVLILCLAFAAPVWAQETEPPKKDGADTPPAAEPAKPDDKPAEEPKAKEDTPADAPKANDAPADAAAAFANAMTQWRDVLTELRDLQTKAQGADDEQLAELNKQWQATTTKANALLPTLRTTGVAAYQAAPNQDRRLSRFLVRLLEDDMKRDSYEAAWALSNTLITGKSTVREIYEHAGLAAFSMQDFDNAEKMFELAEEANSLTPEGQKARSDLEEYRKLWAAEQVIRKKEAEADDLPRVKLTTNRGEVIVELFENEAPETVGNFISLVEDGFYDGLTFHRVLSGFMAQGGCPDGTGRGGPGYQIYCETSAENARMHFRGTLSMAHAGRDTGGSQFFLTFRPTPHLNNRHTVFGRVIEGLEKMSDIRRRDPETANPPTADKIIKAEVLRKREHAYAPNKVQ